MLRTLTIKNYALIDDLQVSFEEGLTVITGETGAGKSILLGALSLLLGKRADVGVLKDTTQKCLVEATFHVGRYELADIFRKASVDFEEHSIFRREILPEGKSRAFINDTPVTLAVLSLIIEKLIDIHSQQETLQLTEDDFQFKVIDSLAANALHITKYRERRNAYHQTRNELQQLMADKETAEKEQDYYSFLLKELQEARLQEGMQEELETTLERLDHAEEIEEKVAQSVQLLSEEQAGVLALLMQVKQLTQKLSGYGKPFDALHQRIASTCIELDDVVSEMQRFAETIEANPSLLEEVNTQLQRLYHLQKKHQVTTISQLIQKQQQIETRVTQTENLEITIKEHRQALLHLEKELNDLAAILHENRTCVVPGLKSSVENLLAKLGLTNARIAIEITPTPTYGIHGKDEVTFLFSANKGTHFGKIGKVASGGERSRLMLSIKALLAEHAKLPTLILDEIDTGVSGEIAHKMGEIMQQMGRTMQVIAITHLPQIASKGNTHLKVYKEETIHGVHTNIKMLNPQERVTEIAGMLSGKNISELAIAHAKDLLSLSTN